MRKVSRQNGCSSRFCVVYHSLVRLQTLFSMRIVIWICPSTGPLLNDDLHVRDIRGRQRTDLAVHLCGKVWHLYATCSTFGAIQTISPSYLIQKRCCIVYCLCTPLTRTPQNFFWTYQRSENSYPIPEQRREIEISRSWRGQCINFLWKFCTNLHKQNESRSPSLQLSFANLDLQTRVGSFSSWWPILSPLSLVVVWFYFQGETSGKRLLKNWVLIKHTSVVLTDGIVTRWKRCWVAVMWVWVNSMTSWSNVGYLCLLTSYSNGIWFLLYIALFYWVSNSVVFSVVLSLHVSWFSTVGREWTFWAEGRQLEKGMLF